MKKLLSVVLTLGMFVLPLVHAEDAAKDKFYGKISAVNQAQKNVTVHNAKQNVDSQFQWDNDTSVKMNKKAIAPTELTVGQSVYVAFVTENDKKKATYIGVRTPFKKAQK
jgi:hypothetical protein